MDKQWKVVPIDPTDEMHKAARDWSYKKYGQPIGLDASTGCYAAMLEAAPQPPSASDEFIKVLDRAISDAYGAGVRRADFDVLAAKSRVCTALVPSHGVSAAEQKPLAYLIDWPDEPELGHYFAEEPTDTGRCRALVLAEAAPSPAASADCTTKTTFSEVPNG